MLSYPKTKINTKPNANHYLLNCRDDRFIHHPLFNSFISTKNANKKALILA